MIAVTFLLACFERTDIFFTVTATLVFKFLSSQIYKPLQLMMFFCIAEGLNQEIAEDGST